MIKFVKESRKDSDAIENLLDIAFSPSRIHLSSYSLREDVPKLESLCFTAKNEFGDILGVVRQWPILIGHAPDNASLLTGPVAVHPIVQGEGLGSSLLNLSLSRAKDEGWKRAILIGDFQYYRHFGFKQQAGKSITFPPPTDTRRVLFLEIESGSFKRLNGKVHKYL